MIGTIYETIDFRSLFRPGFAVSMQGYCGQNHNSSLISSYYDVVTKYDDIITPLDR